MPDYKTQYVRLHNDDIHSYAHMESISSFVFGVSPDEAHECAKKIDTEGYVDFGPFIPEVAQTKNDTIQQINELNSISVKSTIEEY